MEPRGCCAPLPNRPALRAANRNSLARWRALRRVPIRRYFLVKGGNPLSHFPPKSWAANKVRCRQFSSPFVGERGPPGRQVGAPARNAGFSRHARRSAPRTAQPHAKGVAPVSTWRSRAEMAPTAGSAGLRPASPSGARRNRTTPMSGLRLSRSHGAAPSTRVSRSRAMPAGGRRSEAAPSRPLADPRDRYRRKYSTCHRRTARLCSRSVRLNSWVPSFRETK